MEDIEASLSERWAPGGGFVHRLPGRRKRKEQGRGREKDTPETADVGRGDSESPDQRSSLQRPRK
jgi:hypothetical protein